MKIRKKRESFQVTSTCCNECLFSPNRIVDADRKAEIIAQALAKNSYFTCHKAMLAGVDLCCKGFFDIYKKDSLVTRLAVQLNVVEFIDHKTLLD